jgi:hypothetical protein
VVESFFNVGLLVLGYSLVPLSGLCFLFDVDFIDAAQGKDHHDCSQQAYYREPEEETLVSFAAFVDHRKWDKRVLFRAHLNHQVIQLDRGWRFLAVILIKPFKFDDFSAL